MRHYSKVLFFFTMSLFFLFFTSNVRALTMRDDNYILEMGTLGSGGGKPTGTNYKLGVTIGQTAPGLFSGVNYKVKSGFQYLSNISVFRFTVSSNTIDFGILSATNPVKRTNTLEVRNGSANGYQVTASEDHPLQTTSNITIPDTTCDNGSCTQQVAASWSDSSILVYGFGYRCDNVTNKACPSDFLVDYYKQFSDASKKEAPVVIMSNSQKTKSDKADITYKVNISGSQATGEYGNTITYIASPTF